MRLAFARALCGKKQAARRAGVSAAVSTAALAVLLLFQAAAAQTTRDRPLVLVVPFAAGAANDVLARTLATKVQDRLGAVVVENKPGGDAAIGAVYVKNAPRDGRTLLVAPNQYAILAASGRALPYDLLRDFAPVMRTNNLPFFLVVNSAALPVRDLAELVRTVRAAPGRYSYGSAGNGSPHQLAMEMLKLSQGLDIVHVPYKGMAQGIPDLLEGRIQMVITGLPAVSSQLASGKLLVLATVDGVRSPLMPEAPTFAEAGVKDVRMDVWQGLLAPAGTAPETIALLHRSFEAALASEDVRRQLAAQGIDVAPSTPEAFGALIRGDVDRYAKLLHDAHLSLD